MVPCCEVSVVRVWTFQRSECRGAVLTIGDAAASLRRFPFMNRVWTKILDKHQFWDQLRPGRPLSECWFLAPCIDAWLKEMNGEKQT